MLSSFAGKLWDFLKSLVMTILGWFGDVFGNLFSFLGDLFYRLMSFIGDLVWKAVRAVTDFLAWLFAPILELIGAIFHLIGRLIEFLGLLLYMFLKLGQLALAMISGLFRTILGLSFSGAKPSVPPNMAGGIDGIGQAMSIMQLDNFAYVLLVGVWIFTAVAVIRMLGTLRNA